MTSLSRDRISVDLRGLRAALFEQARATGVSPSDFFKEAVRRSMKGADAVCDMSVATPAMHPSVERVRLSFRLSRREAMLLAEAADEAGLPVGTFVVGLAAGIPLLANRGHRGDYLQALVASNAEMATLTRNIHHLTTLLRQGNGQAVLQYLGMVKTLDRDVRRHLGECRGADRAGAGQAHFRRQSSIAVFEDVNMTNDIDAVLVQWRDRLFYPGNRIVRSHTPRITGTSTRQCAAEMRARIAATVGYRVPQVMVKVTGGGRGMKAITAHFRYISKNGRLEIEDELGQRSTGRDAVTTLADDWRLGGTLIRDVGPRREAFNIMLSMPRGIDPLAVQRAAREFAKAELAITNPCWCCTTTRPTRMCT